MTDISRRSRICTKKYLFFDTFNLSFFKQKKDIHAQCTGYDNSCGGKDEKCLTLWAADMMRETSMEDLFSYDVVILICFMKIDKELYVYQMEWKESLSVKDMAFVGLKIVRMGSIDNKNTTLYE